MTAATATVPEQRHVLLDARTGWRVAGLDGIEESPCEDALRLLALPSHGRPLVDPAGSFGGLTEPTGIAVDAWDRIYLADTAANRVKRFDPCCGRFETLPGIGGEGVEPRQLRSPRGLAVSPRGVLYVVDSGNGRIQLFSIRGLALLAIWAPADRAWTPWDIALDRLGRAHVSDRDNGLVHTFDRRGHWVGAVDGAAAGNPPLAAPTHLAVDRAGRIYVVQEDIDHVVVLDPDGGFLGRADAPEHLAGGFRPAAVAADERGNLYVADRTTRRLFAYCCDGPPGAPVRFTGGTCAVDAPVAGLAFDPAGNPLATDPGGARVVRLEGGAAFAPWGRLHVQALDSGRAGCQWHRVLLSAHLPAGDAVEVHTYTAEAEHDPEEIVALPEDVWVPAGRWTEPALGEWDCLVTSPPGRYLWLRLTLEGSGASTPLVTSIRAFFPRLSSIEYLPAVYRSAPEGGTFLERFLSIFDEMAGEIEGVLDRLPAYFDPDSTPAPDFLTWLASWLALTFDGSWDEATRRALLRNATRLYGLRGTERGLREALQLIVGLDPEDCAGYPMPGVLEHFRLRRWLFLGSAALGDTSTLWGRRIVDRLQLGEHSTIGSFRLTDVGDPLRDPFHQTAHRFTVFVPASYCPNEASRNAVERMIELTKPGHTEHDLELVEPRFRVGVQATIGMDSAIGRYPSGAATGASIVGYDAVLQDPPDQPAWPSFRVGVRARLGSTAL